MKLNTKHYQSDFEIDKIILTGIQQYEPPENQWFLWLSRPSGTICFMEQNVFIRDTVAHNTWRYYADQHPTDSILAYAGYITGTMNSRMIGNLHFLDYKQHGKYLNRNSFEPAGIHYVFPDGFRKTLKMQDEKQLPEFISLHGEPVHCRYEPQIPEQFHQPARERHSRSLNASPLKIHLLALQRERLKQQKKSNEKPEL